MKKFILYSIEMQMFVKNYGQNIITHFTSDIYEAITFLEKPTIPKNRNWIILILEEEVSLKGLKYGTNKISEFGYFIIHIVLNKKPICHLNCLYFYKNIEEIIDVFDKNYQIKYSGIKYKICSQCDNICNKNNILVGNK